MTVPEVKNETEKKTSTSALCAVGPGLITGAADDDPSGIATYASAGAAFGYSLLWTAPLAYPLTACIEYICAKIGMVTGEGLAGVLKEYYPRPLLYFSLALLLLANTVNAGTDIGAIAAAINLIFPSLPIISLIVPVGTIILALQLFVSYRTIAKIFKWLTLSLLAYIGTIFFVKINLMHVLHDTFIPSLSFDRSCATMILAILGTTISPYCFFWQASEEVEEETSMGRTERWQRVGATDAELKGARVDVDIGMLVTVVVMYFIMLTTASTLFSAGRFEINTAADAAAALRPFAGPAAELLFALGIIGTGFLAIPVLTTSASYAVAEAFGWQATLDRKPWEAKEFYITITLSTLVGMLINFAGVKPITALFWTAVLNGLLSAPLLVVIMLIANNKEIMGCRTNSIATNVVGWMTTAIMFVAAASLIETSLH